MKYNRTGFTCLQFKKLKTEYVFNIEFDYYSSKVIFYLLINNNLFDIEFLHIQGSIDI